MPDLARKRALRISCVSTGKVMVAEADTVTLKVASADKEVVSSKR